MNESALSQVMQPAPSRRRVVVLSVAIISGLTVAIAAVVAVASVAGGKEPPPPIAAKSATPVRVVTAVQSSLQLKNEYPGELEAEAVELAAETTGRLLDVAVRLGDRFAAGQVLARVDATQIAQQIAEANAQVRAAQASKKSSQAQLASAKTELERGQRLFASQLMSEQNLQELSMRVGVLEAAVEAAEAQAGQAQAKLSLLADTRRRAELKAPFDGAVSQRYLDPGALVQPGKAVLRLVRSGPLRVRFVVPERDVQLVAPDKPLVVTTQATGSTLHEGHVTRVSAEVSRADRSVAVEGVLDQDYPHLRPGMYAKVTLTLSNLEQAVVLPRVAVLQRDHEGQKQSGVFVLDGDRARWQPVTMRGQSGDQAAVEPMAVGTKVIVLGHESLRDGATVRVVGDGAS